MSLHLGEDPLTALIIVASALTIFGSWLIMYGVKKSDKK